MNPHATSAKDGRSAVHWGARNGMLGVVAWLVEACGVEPGLPTAEGDTPFMLAAWQGHMPVCAYLVECGDRECARGDQRGYQGTVNRIPHAVNKWGCNAAFKAARMDGARSSIACLE